ncbi:Tat proofreading chaperone DmsD [Budviciaceae bacterium BWR-B9]|uniref:Tat proofreading chaperone DmsD n=1 Tax=Limnobaculum allomyrinae TaxID=2791986 RepID=A0ABS1IMJ5_9GAMM|nr:MULTISPECIES: Tat proofreading chaperone DmsD [Limnobaculum]MBK5142973.1 Tat proofreading chaperone DmsD [Limnobaculum allomyrinae]MBV7693302.1 Tat proofreading chaperone DmsD [Limnobaculum sp. M2-1]
MLMNTTIPRIIGACFYYPPQTALIAVLPDLVTLFPWPQPESVRQQTERLTEFDAETLMHDYSMLFEGIGVMPAPPWGSVYLERENLLMGDSTLNYRQFLAQQGMVTNTDNPEPEDQFGLMLMAFAYLLESDKPAAAQQLLSEHLLPWAERYLTLVQASDTEQDFYPQLAEIARLYLQTLQQQLNVPVEAKELYL